MGCEFLCKREALSPDYPTPVSVMGKEIAVYLIGDEVFATDNVCSHEYALLSDGFLEDGCIECPLHQGVFDVRTGGVISGPPKQPINTYPVHIDGPDVYVELL